MNTETEMIETPAAGAEDAQALQSKPTQDEEIAALRRDMAALQEQRITMEDKLSKIVVNNDRFKAAKAEQVVAETPAPTLSREMRLNLIADAAGVKIEALREERRAAEARLLEIKAERDSIDHALGDAERRMTLLSGSRGDYVDARAQTIAAKMMGQDVKVEQANSDPMAGLTPTDVQAGVKALRRRREDVARAWNMALSDHNRLTREIGQKMAVVAGCKYEIAAESLKSAFVDLLAIGSVCKRKGENLGHMVHIYDFVNPNVETELKIPAVCGDVQELRGVGGWDSAYVRTTGLLQARMSAVEAEMTGSAK